MRRFETSIAIAAPREAAWRLLGDVADWGDWLPTVSSVAPRDCRSLRPGARFCIVQPGLQAATWQVTALEAPRHFAWESRVPGMHTIADHVFEEEGDGRCRVTLRIDMKGPLSAIVGFLYGGLTQRYIETEAATLKAKLEAA